MRIDMGQRGHNTFSWVQGSERTMSEHDDTLLDEDLGDEEYDLGNDEEEALLADDYEVDRQNSYKGEEETDDVLDLGVTDALDDLEADDENVEFNRSKTDEHSDHDFYKEEDVHQETGRSYYEQVENREHKEEEIHRHDGSLENALNSNAIGKGDLREKLQKNVQKVYVGDGQALEDDECEEARERRNRFQNERTMISPKMNNNIPDTLENVVTSESSRPSFRGRGRGRGARGSRGGRFITQNCASFNPRFGNARNVPFENQQQVCRPPLLETRPPFPLGVPNSMQNQQIVYQPNNSQVQSFQQFPLNGPPQQGPPRFVDNRPQFNPGQFQGTSVPRPLAPRMNFEPRVSLHGSMQRPPYNCPPNQPAYLQMQPPPFQNTGAIMQDGQGRPAQSNQGPLLHGNPGGSLLGNPNPLLQGNQPLPMQGFPRQHRFGQAPLVPSDPNVPIPSQPAREGRQPFQEPRFNLRPPYMEQVPNNQFNNNTLPVPQQPVSSMSGVALPSGHKILINPHFRGAVQPSNDARLAWDSTQHQGPPQPQIPNNQFNNPPAPYQNQNSYNQSQQGSAQYQQNYSQNKNDDPYAYFSDVWQENRPQKTQATSPTKQYSLESSYTRESSYNDSGSKYKSDNQWEQRDNYQEEHRGVHQSYRERDLPSRPRSDHVQKSRLPSSGTYRGDSYDQNQKSASSRPMNVTSRGPNKSPQKRVSDTTDRSPRDPSPKRSKTSSRNLHEVRTVEIPSDVVSEKKEEDSDPEMQEYRKKMEEQKRLREIILREKENRRKMAAMEKQTEEVKNDPGPTASENTQQEAKPVSVLMGVKDTVINKARTCVGRGRGHPVNAQNTEANERPNIRIVRTIQPIQSTDSLSPANAKDEHSGQAANQFDDTSHVKQLTPQPGTRRVVIHKPLTNSQKIATTIQKTVSNLQKGQPTMQNKLTGNLQNIQKVGQVQAMKKQVAGQKVVNKTQRVVVPQKSIGTLQKSIINVQDVANANVSKVVVNTQNNQRVVLQKSLSQAKKVTDIKTNTVKLENLAASTSEVQIRRMCQGIGTIESIHMGEGSATIVFKTQSAAMVFHKKYQRKMLDLSLITVRLVPQTSVNKAATVVNKS